MDNFVILPDPLAQAAAYSLARAREAGAAWAATPLERRLAVVARARRLLAKNGPALAALVSRPEADTLVAELLPLAEAACWLVRQAPGLLAPRTPRGIRPLWLAGVRAELLREPVGTVLILAPGNYPLFLPGVQVLQAIAAGNAVCAKPAPGRGAVLHAFAAVLAEAGLPPAVLQILDDTEDAGRAAAGAGFDLVVLTGSADTGRQVLAACAPNLTPVIAELSGVDAAFVLPGADLGLVADCLAYGLRLNAGATCIAPRRVFVTAADAAALEILLAGKATSLPSADVPAAIAARLAARITEAIAAGARLIAPLSPGAPVLLAGASARMALLQEDIFAPWLALVSVADPETALIEAARCPYALGASVFGPEAAARAFARRVRAGSVCVNDLIAPTADPRLPFGGRGRSGFGATRGAEGLLAMTSIKAVSIRRGRFRPHLAAPHPADSRRFAAMLALLHGSLAVRAASVWRLAARALWAPLLAAMLVVPVHAHAALTLAEQQSQACKTAIAAAEHRWHTPPGLLLAIARSESGRPVPPEPGLQPWPWAIDADGLANFTDTKAAAVAWVDARLAAGAQRVDVGCMQIDLQAHPHAFPSLDEAFDPAANAQYAAHVLVTLAQAAGGNWYRAIGWYHSRTPALAALYRERVAAIAAGRTPPTGAGEPLYLRAIQQGTLRLPLVGGGLLMVRTNRQPSAVWHRRLSRCQVAALLAPLLSRKPRLACGRKR